jgi:hypothetical protein
MSVRDDLIGVDHDLISRKVRVLAAALERIINEGPPLQYETIARDALASCGMEFAW